MNKIKAFILHKPPVSWLIAWSKTLVLPGFDGMPVYDVADFFMHGIRKGAVTMRASALAYSFFLAIFPSVIFLFTLIPYIPIKGFQDELLTFIKDFLPKSAYAATIDTIEDIIKHQRSGLLSFGFLSAMYFSTNGINAMMKSFNQTVHSIETRPQWQQRLISIMLTLILSFLVILAVSLIIFSEFGFHYLVKIHWLKSKVTYQILLIGKWLIIVALFFTAISFLYYWGPAKRKRYRFVSAGSTLATVLTLVISLGFAFFVNNFGSYNKLYGSIGSLIVIMLWIYFNSLVLLIGFELNASIDNAGIVIKKPKPKSKLFSILRG